MRARWWCALALLGACGDGARPPGLTGPDATVTDAPVAGRCRLDLDCNDFVDCTQDTCRAGTCAREPLASRCGAGSACHPQRGCTPRRSCSRDQDCADDDACTLDERCDQGLCVFTEALAGTPCGAVGSERACRGGLCACPEGRPTLCRDRCVDTSADPDHCGSCGLSCGGGGWCLGGACRCSAPQAWCPGAGCVDLSSAPDACGACGNRCPATARCEEGRCRTPCLPGTHRCGEACAADTSVDSCGARCEPCPRPPGATSACAAGNCTFTCGPNTHRCGDRCADDDNVNTCGALCVPCPTPMHGRAACLARACAPRCDPGYHGCDTRCLDDAAVASCGERCEPCVAPAHGRATCAAGRCGIACDAGYRACGDRCSDGTDPQACGEACVRCPAPADGAATCVSGRCAVRCNLGFHDCAGRCLRDTSPASCGTLCAPCPAPAHAQATCSAGRCDFGCDPGYRREGDRCRELPRPVSPPDMSRVSTRRPTVRFRLPAEATRATVQFCQDRACTTVLASRASMDQSATPMEELPTGVVFWRVLSDGDLPGPTWWFRTPARSATVATFGLLTTDVDGDGYGDLVAGAPFLALPGSRLYTHLGGPMGARTPGQAVESPEVDSLFGMVVVGVGDVNGDGYGDVAVGAPGFAMNTGRAYVFHGGNRGLEELPASTLRARTPVGGFYGAALAGGDLNGDGYSDVVVGAYRALREGVVSVYFGSPQGIPEEASRVLPAPGPAEGRMGEGRYGIAVAVPGDLDGDGFADLVAGADAEDGFTGRVYLHRGGRDGPSLRPEVTLQRLEGGQYGSAVAGVGDVDGDGRPDVAVGGPGFRDGLGGAYVYAGSARGLEAERITVIPGPAGVNADFGLALGGGDFDGDGYSDVVVSAPRSLDYQGQVYVFQGSAMGVRTSPWRMLPGPTTPRAYHGNAVSVGRDIDRDGYDDIVVSAERASTFVGQARVFYGSASGLDRMQILTGPDGPGGRFGFSVACWARPAARPRG
ncbi:MAG: FG-GAP repeat protein [Deltaproteobacteria bacterium]|nr:FG-GAP repeat protein [Deltaproteobacteria bacterium]